MSELSIQLKIQEIIQGLSLFSDADVVINDWSIFDRPNIEAPYVLIQTSDDFESLHQVMTAEVRWAIPIVLVERFTDWKETYDKFRDRRQQILDEFNLGDDERSGPGLNIDRIGQDTPITEFYDKVIPVELQSEALPAFIMQRLILEAQEF